MTSSTQSAALDALYGGEKQRGEQLLSHEPTVFEAAAFGLVDRLGALLNYDENLVHSRSADDFTALHLAAFFDQPEAVDLLLDRGADPEAEATNSFVSAVRPLHSAAAAGSFECCELLLKTGADVDARQADGFTALMAAAQSGNTQLANLLLTNGADPSLVCPDGTTAESLALEKLKPGTLAVIRDAEAQMHAKQGTTI